jgi:hypothetical protein
MASIAANSSCGSEDYRDITTITRIITTTAIGAA